MARASRKLPVTDGKAEMWIRPGSVLKGTHNGNNGVDSSSNSRYLELADIALGLKKPEGRKKKPAARIRASEKV